MVSMKSVPSSFFLRHHGGLLSEWLPSPGGFGFSSGSSSWRGCRLIYRNPHEHSFPAIGVSHCGHNRRIVFPFGSEVHGTVGGLHVADEVADGLAVHNVGRVVGVRFLEGTPTPGAYVFHWNLSQSMYSRSRVSFHHITYVKRQT